MSEYQFRREDNGEIVEVDWGTAINQDAAGFITLPDGVQAKRVNRATHKAKVKANQTDGPIISDNLGFTAHQLEEMTAHRDLHKFTGVEFVRDPQVPTFYQVKCAGPDEHRRYMESRGFYDKNGRNGGSGGGLSPEILARAEQLVKRERGAA